MHRKVSLVGDINIWEFGLGLVDVDHYMLVNQLLDAF